MSSYNPPQVWVDGVWLHSRTELDAAFRSGEPVDISFVNCHWIDLQPLLDVLVLTAAHAGSGGVVTFEVDPNTEDPTALRTLRFLLESGFISALTAPRISTFVRIHSRNADLLPNEFIESVGSPTLPPRLLDYETLIPCTALDTAELLNRAAVFEYCKELKAKWLTDRAKAFRMPPPLIYETRVYFDAVLPELIDNVRIHKPDTPFCAFHARYRRREESFLLPRIPAVADPTAAAPLDQRTRHYWNSDMVEAAFADTGVGIQESWIRRWRERHLKLRRVVPRLASGIRVDGVNGAVEILKGVFKENASSLTADERLRQDLPANLTGLHSIKQSIQDSDWTFSVRSAANYVIVSSRSSDNSDDESPAPVDVRPVGRYPSSTGVHFLFRFVASQGRVLRGWSSAVPPKGIANDPAWWNDTYPADYERIHVVDRWELPNTANRGDVVLLRPAHVLGKGQVLEFMQRAHEREVNLIFCEIPEPTALRVFLLLNSLITYEGVPMRCPVMTNTQYVNVPGNNGQAFARSFVRGSSRRAAWWSDSASPVRSAKDVFARCRQVDSKRFWSVVANDKSAFLPEPVKWSDGLVLRGGYLSFISAIRHRSVRKLVRKRLLATLHAVRADQVLPASNQMRHVTNQLRRISGFDDVEARRVGIVANVYVSGSTARASVRLNALGSTALIVPTFLYPMSAIDPVVEGPSVPIRALDWVMNPEVPPVKPRYSRIGRTGRIRRISSELLSIDAIQPPTAAYRIWQQHGLLRIGHFSHTRHHLYVWLDLLAFLNSKTADSNEMVTRLAGEIARLKPHAVFYASNEVSEVLVDRIGDFIRHNPTPDFPLDRVWPITSVSDFSNLQTGNVSAGLIEPPPSDSSVAVFLDDVVLTGATARLAQSHLVRLGYATVHIVTALDRSEPDIDLIAVSGHFVTWWSVGIRSLGPSHACAICRGIDGLRLLAAQTSSEIVRSALGAWIQRWTNQEDFLHHDTTVEGVALPQVLNKKLASDTPNVSIHTSAGLSAWALEVIGRLRFYGYLFDTPRPDLSPVLSELLSGLILMYWHEINHAHQRATLATLATQLWSEPRDTARELIVIALMSIPRTDADAALDAVQREVEQHGVPHLDAALAYYSLLHVAIPNAAARADRLERVRHIVRAGVDDLEVAGDRGVALLTLFAELERGAPHHRLAIRVLGPPTGTKYHHYLQFALEQISRTESPSRDTSSFIGEIRALLEPVRTVARERTALLEEFGLAQPLQKAFAEFDRVVVALHSGPSGWQDASYDALRRNCTDLYLLLAVGSPWRPSLRRVLGREYVHYPPFLVREAIEQIVRWSAETGLDLNSSDILVDAALTTEERSLLLVSDDATRLELIEALQDYDVVCCDRQYLITAFRDLLMDVRHPKAMALPLSSPTHYMRITCVADPQFYRVSFATRGSPEDAAAAEDGRTLRSVQFLIQEQEGRVQFSFDAERGVIRKTLSLPIFRRRQKEYVGEN